MGRIYDKPWKHLTGCAIYPASIRNYNGPSLMPARSKSPVPWDVVNPQATLRHTHETKLIEHLWGTDNVPPTFPLIDDLKRIPKEAALFHRCKDGSLIDRLREQRVKPSIVARIASVAEKVLAPKPFVKPKSSATKVDLLYICVRSPSEPNVPRNFRESHERFVRTYKQFKPSIPHRLIVVCYNGERDREVDELFGSLNPEYMHYRGTAFDIGTYLTIGRTLDSDFVLCCGSNVHFWKHGWLERMVEAFQKHGPGAYAPMASYETSPHLRTCCIGTTPKLLRQYPHPITTREETYMFESGMWNFTHWIQSQGLPALMVMQDEELAQPEWRKPANIFRRGDQSNCIIWDRHTLVYQSSTPDAKAHLAKMADGGFIGNSCGSGRARYKTITVVAVTSLNGPGHAKAIEWTCKLIPHPCEKLLISSDPAPGFTGKQIPLPAPWAKDGKWAIPDMCDFLLTGLHKYITTDVAILVHDDGYALNKSKWSDEFLDYDYIGAPWPSAFTWTKPGRRVGNGGFSLRSRRWLDCASQLYRLPPNISEDVWVNVTHLEHFTHRDCRIAPLDVAMRWSFEHVIEEYPKWTMKDSFGWHGRKQEPTRKHLVLC
jgi:hypothetical protein